jgi:hypothetical protein
MTSTGLIPNGKAIVTTSGNIIFNNFEFSGATVGDGNPQSPDELDWFILLRYTLFRRVQIDYSLACKEATGCLY